MFSLLIVPFVKIEPNSKYVTDQVDNLSQT
jgi:hypothetical protein